MPQSSPINPTMTITLPKWFRPSGNYAKTRTRIRLTLVTGDTEEIEVSSFTIDGGALWLYEFTGAQSSIGDSPASPEEKCTVILGPSAWTKLEPTA